MKTFKLTPLDTLFFRDGRPFNLGETGQLEVTGTFPPSPTTVVGALRAALARANGWDGHSGWKEEIKKVLGDGEQLGSLNFLGPYLMRNAEVLFPPPLHLMGKRREDKSCWKYLSFLVPGSELKTDLNLSRLPKIVEVKDENGKPVEGFKNLESYWLTAKGMRRVLTGKLPESSDIIPQHDLWNTEPRVGIKRDLKSRTTKEDSLYNIGHVRLQEGVSLGVRVSGLPEDWQPQNPALLGGESRMVWLTETEKLTLPEAPELPENHTIRYTVTLITPARLEDDAWRTPNGKLADLPGKVISACVGKPVMIGGWNSLKKEPLPLKPYLPAGSTWFLEAQSDEKNAVLAKHSKHIGAQTAWGYGQILIGTWEDTHR